MSTSISSQRRGTGAKLSVILIALMLAVILEIVSLSDFLDQQKPEFAAVVLIYYSAITRFRFGIELALLTGFTIDLLQGAPLGINALTLCAQVYLICSQFQNFRVYLLWQQAVIVGMVNIVVGVTCYWLAHMLGQTAYEANFLIPAGLLVLLWFPFRIILDFLVKPNNGTGDERSSEV